MEFLGNHFVSRIVSVNLTEQTRRLQTDFKQTLLNKHFLRIAH